MRKKISGHKFTNGKEIVVHLVTGKDKIEEVDDFTLTLRQGKKGTVHHLRPDEMMIIIKILSDALLERVVAYSINTGKLRKEDYDLRKFLSPSKN